MTKSIGNKTGGNFTITKKNKDGYNGTYVCSGICFPFTIRPCKKEEYSLRGTMHIADPKGQHYLQLSGKERKDKLKKLSSDERAAISTGQRSEKLTISREFYITTATDKEIRSKVIRTAEELIKTHSKQLNNLLREAVQGQDVTAEEAFMIFGKQFFAETYTQGISEGTMRKKEKKLKAVCEATKGKMSKLTAQKIDTVFVRPLTKNGHNSGSIKEALVIADKFWDYCKEQGVNIRDNPFRLYLNTHAFTNKQVSSRTLNAQLVYTKLDTKQIELLMTDASNKLEDGRYSAIPICLSCGMPFDKIVNLCWKDLTWKNDVAFLYFHIEHSRSGVSNYEVPLTYKTAEFLKERWKSLKSQYSSTKIKSMPIISHKSDTEHKLTEAQLTHFLDKVLVEHKIPFRLDEKSTYAKATIFRTSFEEHLTTICGVPKDSAEFRYFTGRSLANDVTNDRYRSFRSDTGKQYLVGLIRRMDSSRPAINQPADLKEDSMLYIAGKPNKVTEIILKIECVEGDACDLTISSGYGFRCSEYNP